MKTRLFMGTLAIAIGTAGLSLGCSSDDGAADIAVDVDELFAPAEKDVDAKTVFGIWEDTAEGKDTSIVVRVRVRADSLVTATRCTEKGETVTAVAKSGAEVTETSMSVFESDRQSVTTKSGTECIALVRAGKGEIKITDGKLVLGNTAIPTKIAD